MHTFPQALLACADLARDVSPSRTLLHVAIDGDASPDLLSIYGSDGKVAYRFDVDRCYAGSFSDLRGVLTAPGAAFPKLGANHAIIPSLGEGEIVWEKRTAKTKKLAKPPKPTPVARDQVATSIVVHAGRDNWETFSGLDKVQAWIDPERELANTLGLLRYETAVTLDASEGPGHPPWLRVAWLEGGAGEILDPATMRSRAPGVTCPRVNDGVAVVVAGQLEDALAVISDGSDTVAIGVGEAHTPVIVRGFDVIERAPRAWAVLMPVKMR